MASSPYRWKLTPTWVAALTRSSALIAAAAASFSFSVKGVCWGPHPENRPMEPTRAIAVNRAFIAQSSFLRFPVYVFILRQGGAPSQGKKREQPVAEDRLSRVRAAGVG